MQQRGMADTSGSSVPTQAAVIEAWEQRLKACPVYAKSTKVLAKEMVEAGELETVIKGVSGQSMEAVLGMPTQPPLGHIGLANDDGTRCPDTRNVGVILCRDE